MHTISGLVLGVEVNRSEFFEQYNTVTRCPEGHDQEKDTHVYCPTCGAVLKKFKDRVPNKRFLKLVDSIGSDWEAFWNEVDIYDGTLGMYNVNAVQPCTIAHPETLVLGVLIFSLTNSDVSMSPKPFTTSYVSAARAQLSKAMRIMNIKREPVFYPFMTMFF